MKPHRILKDFKGTQDGHGDGQEFTAGTTVPLSDQLADVVVRAGWAKPHTEEVKETDEEKAIEEAPANKARKAAPENKSKK